MKQTTDARQRRHTTCSDSRYAAEIDWDAPEISTLLREAGLRPTTARRWIVALLRTRHDHPSVNELKALLRADGREVKQATLYQGLAALAEAGVIASFLDAEGLMRFDGTAEAHPHLVCVRCDAIADVELSPREERRLEGLSAEVITRHRDWRITQTRLELRALCPTCAGDS